MERFRPFIGRSVDRAALDSPFFRELGLEPRYLPDQFDELDEMEFLLPLEEGKSLVFSAALEQGRIMRMLAGWAAPGDPEDAMRKLEDEELRRILAERGDLLVRFLQAATAGPPRDPRREHPSAE